jgi:hypothetical protein
LLVHVLAQRRCQPVHIIDTELHRNDRRNSLKPLCIKA